MVSRINIIDNKGNFVIVEVPPYVTEILKEIEIGELSTFDTVMEFCHMYNLKVIEFNGRVINKYTTCIEVNDSAIVLDGEDSLLHIELDETIVTLKETKSCVLRRFNKLFTKYMK
jgi:hypothetical protein